MIPQRTLALSFTMGTLALAACGASDHPCTTCPSISGTYNVRFDQGPPAPLGCTGAPAPAQEGPLVLSQQGAAIQGNFAGSSLSGTLLDTYDLRLTGPASFSGADTLTLSGRYVASPSDGGFGRYLGTLQQVSGPASTGDGGICSESAAFTATHE